MLVFAAIKGDKSQQRFSAEQYIQKTRAWKHTIAEPPTPLGSRPSPNVSIHFWSSEKCFNAELRVEGKSYGTQAVPCHVKLVIYQHSSEGELLMSWKPDKLLKAILIWTLVALVIIWLPLVRGLMDGESYHWDSSLWGYQLGGRGIHGDY